MHEQPLSLHILELLLTWLASLATEYQLSPELPSKRNVPVLSSLLVNDGVVVLQVRAKALGLERNPESILMHGVGLLAEVAEVVGVEREVLAELFNGLGRLVEKNL